MLCFVCCVLSGCCVWQPLEQRTQFGSEFHSVSLLLHGPMRHVGDIYVEGGGVLMGTGSFTVANLDFSRAREVSFLGPSAVLGAGRGRRIDVKGKMRFADQYGATYVAIDPDGSLQARKLSSQTGLKSANASWLRSNVSSLARFILHSES